MKATDSHVTRFRTSLGLPPDQHHRVTRDDSAVLIHQDDGDHLRLTVALDGRHFDVRLFDARHRVLLGSTVYLPQRDVEAMAREYLAVPERPQRNRRMAEFLPTASLPFWSGHLAVPGPVLLFTRDVSGGSGGSVPTRADGRFEVDGYVEPYPGAWPQRAVHLCRRTGDLSGLWPYLTEGDVPVSPPSGGPVQR